MKNILGSLPARLLLGVIAGILVGLYANEALMQVILTIKILSGSLPRLSRVWASMRRQCCVLLLL